MKQLFIVSTILLCLLIIPAAFGQISDSLSQTTLSGQVDSAVINTEPLIDGMADDFAPGLFLFAIGTVACMLLFIGAGITITVVGLLVIFALVSFGILSTSVIVGLHRKSLAKGVKTFVLLTSIVGGVLCCSVFAIILNQILHWWTPQTAIIIGSGSGLIGGLIVGLLANKIGQRMTTAIFKQKLNLTEGDNSFLSA